jgi:hypothetical protein
MRYTGAGVVAGAASACALVPGIGTGCAAVAGIASAVSLGTGIALRVTGGSKAESNLDLGIDVAGVLLSAGGDHLMANLDRASMELEEITRVVKSERLLKQLFDFRDVIAEMKVFAITCTKNALNILNATLSAIGSAKSRHG